MNGRHPDMAGGGPASAIAEEKHARHVVVLGSGFAGLWAALGAARRVDELGAVADDVVVTVISRQPYHDIRVRDYETDLAPTRIELRALLDPVGVIHRIADVTAIDTGSRTVTTSAGAVNYDRLIVALGSQVNTPDVPGFTTFGFDVDTHDAALRLQRHLERLGRERPTLAAATVVVVGAGLTGIETATELPGRLRSLFPDVAARVILVDHHPRVGSDMGDFARPVIETALAEVGVQTRLGVGVTAVERDAVTLSSGERVAAATVVWCAGMRANPLVSDLGVQRDELGRVAADTYMRVVGVSAVFAAGDVAAARVDGEHYSVMSCQHARPMGRFAGHNAVGDLCGAPMKSLQIPCYVTVLDLGPAGAVYTRGWDRQVASTGAEAKKTKRTINCERIYPPMGGNRDKLLQAAAPTVQPPPEIAH